MLKLLAEDKKARFILTSGNDEEKYVSKEELEKCLKKYINNEKIKKMNLKDAIENIKECSKDRTNLVIGSFYVYGTVVEEIEKNFKK